MNGIVVCSGKCKNWTSFENAELYGWHTILFPARRCVRYFCRQCWHLQQIRDDVKPIPAFELLGLFFTNSLNFKAIKKTQSILIDGTEIKRWGQPIWLLDYHIVTIGEKRYKVTDGDLGYHVAEFKPHTN